MSVDRIAAYADAVYRIAEAELELERVESELAVIGKTIDTDRELRHTLTDPRFPQDRKRSLLESILSGRVSPTTVDLVGLIIDRGHGGDLSEIARAVSELAAVGRGKQLAEVTSAIALSPEQIARLEQSIGRLVGAPVEVQVSVDPQLLGGMVTRIGDTVIDGTVRRQLTNLKEDLGL